MLALAQESRSYRSASGNQFDASDRQTETPRIGGRRKRLTYPSERAGPGFRYIHLNFEIFGAGQDRARRNRPAIEKEAYIHSFGEAAHRRAFDADGPAARTGFRAEPAEKAGRAVRD